MFSYFRKLFGPQPDLKLSHAREFTNHEDKTLDAWLVAENAGLDEIAAEILDTGLMLEHYTSLLDNDPDKRSNAQKEQLLRLHEAFETALDKLSEALEPESG